RAARTSCGCASARRGSQGHRSRSRYAPVERVAPLAREEIERAYREYHHSVLRRATQMLGNEQAAREVVQEVFVSLVPDPGQFRGATSIATWLYSATTPLCLNRIRDRENRARLLDERYAPAQAGAASAPLEELTAARQLLARLPERLARVAVY